MQTSFAILKWVFKVQFPESTAMIKIKNVTKSYGDIVALDDVSLEIDKGEFVFVTGPSGAGKTTLLKLILRDVVPDSGEVFVGEDNVVDFDQKDVQLLRQKIGVVFQDFKVLFERTVRENVEVALAVCGVPQEEWEGRANKVLELVGLSDRADFFPAQLSGGELQRVTLARALVVNPDIILADEPTGNLDWDTAEGIVNLLETIHKEGKTVIMATHHKVLVEKDGSRQVEFKEGKIVKDPKAKKESEGTKKTKSETKDKENTKPKSKEAEVKAKEGKEDKKDSDKKDKKDED